MVARATTGQHWWGRRAVGGVGAVGWRGRPPSAVLADMIEGVVVTNELRSPDADRVRTELWSIMDRDDQQTRMAAA